MEKTKRYSSLKGLINASKYNEFTLQNLISSRMLHKEDGWTKIILSPELKKEIVGKFIEVIGGRDTSDIRRNLMRGDIKSYQMYERLGIRNYPKLGIKTQYAAGQNYPEEIVELRRLIRKG